MLDPSQKKKGKATLHVHIKEAQSLPNMDTIGYTDGFVKMCLLPNRMGRKKSNVISDNLNPRWDEKFTFSNLNLAELSIQRVLELTVWDHDMLSSNDFIGGLRLGPAPGKGEGHKEWMDSNSKEARHWEEMLATPRKWVEFVHPLRASMNPRKVTSNPALELSIKEAENLLTHDNIEERKAEGVFRPRVCQ